MSSIIDEDPELSMNVKYSKGEDRGERLEGLVLLHENVDSCTDHQVHVSTQDGEPHTENHLPAVQRNRFRVLGLILALLLLALLIVVCIRYTEKLMSDNKKLASKYETLISKNMELMVENEKLTSDLERMNCQFGKENQTQANTTEWKRFECSCYYISTERKNWSESRKDCERRGADLLVIKTRRKHEFFRELNKRGDFWIGLERKAQTKDWSKTWEWEWVDGSPLAHIGWSPVAKLDPEDDFKVFMDLQGTWNYTNTGSKHWICERDIY
ncbi:CD209 antigen-like protein A [Simochromis diagramma]|uniref:CD209 antigen-like protein A n=1 Tax=Simochromis diagramma TaxID=43689 RepID=UPI001A7E79E0|nr:CD209 antigen-like protein A [Simochromis diagramma]